MKTDIPGYALLAGQHPTPHPNPRILRGFRMCVLRTPEYNLFQTSETLNTMFSMFCAEPKYLSNVFRSVLLRKTRLKSHLERFWMQHRRVLHVPVCRPSLLPKFFLRLLWTEALKSKMSSVSSSVVGCGMESTWARIDAEP